MEILKQLKLTENVNKIDKPLSRLIKKKRKRTQKY